VLVANFGKWKKGIHVMRITQFFYRGIMIVNSILFFLNFTNILKAIAVMVSIIIFYTKFFLEKKQAKAEQKLAIKNS